MGEGCREICYRHPRTLLMTIEQPLVFFVDPAWRRRGIHSPLMNPWWSNATPSEYVFAKQMFDTYSFDTSYYRVTGDVTEADFVFAPYPHTWLLRHDTVLLETCVRAAKVFGRPLFLDGMGDIEHPVPEGEVYVLRYGGYRFLPERGRIQIPPLADDFLERYRGGRLSLRPKQDGTPSVGFAGWSKLSPIQYARTIVKELPVRARGIVDRRYRACIKGVLWRSKALDVLSDSPFVRLHSLARTSFSASPKTAQGDMAKLRQEMVDIILESDYALDVRGDANASTRLFEILSLGRIPVIVDTERNFPFSDKVDYASFALVVDFRDIKHLPKRIAEFHKSISPERYEQMQRNARDAYERYFRIDALMQHIVEELRGKSASRAT